LKKPDKMLRRKSVVIKKLWKKPVGTELATGKAQEKLFSQIEELQKRLAEAEVNKELD
jgi:hypothetical protein